MGRSMKCDSARSENLCKKHVFLKAATCSKQNKKKQSASCMIRAKNDDPDKIAKMPRLNCIIIRVFIVTACMIR